MVRVRGTLVSSLIGSEFWLIYFLYILETINNDTQFRSYSDLSQYILYQADYNIMINILINKFYVNIFQQQTDI